MCECFCSRVDCSSGISCSLTGQGKGCAPSPVERYLWTEVLVMWMQIEVLVILHDYKEEVSS